MRNSRAFVSIGMVGRVVQAGRVVKVGRCVPPSRRREAAGESQATTCLPPECARFACYFRRIDVMTTGTGIGTAEKWPKRPVFTPAMASTTAMPSVTLPKTA